MNAIVLAGGRGTRLIPFVSPKTLVPLNGSPILYRLLWHLHKAVDNAVICTGYRASDIESALKWVDWKEMSYDSVECSNAGEDALMGARLVEARKIVNSIEARRTDSDGRTLICYGDELADVDIAKLLKRHDGAWMTFACAQARVPGGTVTEVAGEDHDGVRIIDEEARLINIGFVVVEPQCWALLKPEDGLSDWVNRVSEEHGRVRVYYHEGKRATVNTLADLEAAEKVWR